MQIVPSFQTPVALIPMTMPGLLPSAPAALPGSPDELARIPAFVASPELLEDAEGADLEWLASLLAPFAPSQSQSDCCCCHDRQNSQPNVDVSRVNDRPARPDPRIGRPRPDTRTPEGRTRTPDRRPPEPPKRPWTGDTPLRTPQNSGKPADAKQTANAKLSPEDEALARRIDDFLDATADSNAGKANNPQGQPNQGLRGQGRLIVSLAREYDLPVELMMAQLQKESSFLSDANNLSIANNNPGNLRYAEWESKFGGKPGGPGNFTTFGSVEDGLRAYGHLLRNVYGEFIDKQDWQGLVYKYAPPSENDSGLYTDQLIRWMGDFRQKLGI